MSTIKELEQRIHALESEQVDSASPTFIVVGADGSITFDFDGHIHADGLDLDEVVGSTTPEDHAVNWNDSGGTRREYIVGQDILGTHRLLLSADTATMFLSNGPVDTVTFLVGAINPTLITSDDESDFLRFAGTTPRTDKISYGTGTVTGDGTADNTDTVAHGMGDSPGFAWAFPFSTALSSGGSGRLIPTFESADATNLTFRFRSNNDANWNNDITYMWFAIINP